FKLPAAGNLASREFEIESEADLFDLLERLEAIGLRQLLRGRRALLRSRGGWDDQPPCCQSRAPGKQGARQEARRLIEHGSSPRSALPRSARGLRRLGCGFAAFLNHGSHRAP